MSATAAPTPGSRLLRPDFRRWGVLAPVAAVAVVVMIAVAVLAGSGDDGTVQVAGDATGALIGVEVEGQSEPPELIETKASQPVAPFGDEEYKAKVRPWLYA